jgi:hypothetical protein
MQFVRTHHGLLALCAVVQLAACTKSNSPTGPSPTNPSAAVRVSLGPAPVQARAHWSTSGLVRYQVEGTATFQNSSPDDGEITHIQVALITPSGYVEARTVPVSITVPPGGLVTHHISQALELSRAMVPTNLRVSAQVDSDRAAPAEITAEAPVTIAIAAEGGAFPDATFIGAGDIAICNWSPSEATARVLDGQSGTVFTLGDNVYPTGTAAAFTDCYGPTWGRHRSRTRPTPGNHDWDVSAGAPYFSYFGAAAGPAGLGYYSFNVGSWHVLSLNSNIPADPGSAQYEWARTDLMTSNTACSVAVWHHPRFSSGQHGNHPSMREMWRLLHEAGVEVVLAGHDHTYERFAPQDADGRFDPQGIRGFVVGTGGAVQRPFGVIQPNSELRENQAYGVLKLSLRSRSYDWEFLPVSGQSFRDLGTAQCR